jgi:hypothetical protein
MKYHLTPDGPKACSATVKTCKYGEVHFNELREAEEAFAKSFGDSIFSGVKGNKAGELSAETSRAYGHWSILNDHLHNAGDMGNEAEVLYYSSPQGKLELARRQRVSGGYKEYDVIAERVENFDKDSFSYDLDETVVKNLVAEGEALLQKDSKFLENESLNFSKDNDPLRHYLVEESHRWLEKLTPEEQETVSWLTSNGFGLMQYSFGYKTENAGNYFKGLVNEEEIWDKHPQDFEAAEAEVEAEKKRIADEFRTSALSALNKAPKLDKPVVIARGTSLAELGEITNMAKDSKDYKTLMDSIEAGDFNGKNVASNARMSKIPQSAAVRAETAIRFSNRLWDQDSSEDREVVIALKSKTFASPVNVGAWGTGEYEVFTNPLSTYKITGGRRVRDDLFILELEED